MKGDTPERSTPAFRQVELAEGAFPITVHLRRDENYNIDIAFIAPEEQGGELFSLHTSEQNASDLAEALRGFLQGIAVG